MAFDILNHPQWLTIGFQGESGVRSFDFDCNAWLDEFPGGTIKVTVILPSDTPEEPEVFPVPPNQAVVTDGVLSLTILHNITLKAGVGSFVIKLVEGEDIEKRSAMINFYVNPSHPPVSGEIPSILVSWVAELEGKISEANTAIAGANTAVSSVDDAKIVSASFVGNDMVFVKQNSETVTIPGALNTLRGFKGDKGEPGSEGPQGPKGDPGTIDPADQAKLDSIASPSNADAGHVLTADGAGGSVWAEPTGGGGGGTWKTTESALPVFFPAQGSDIVARLSGTYRQLGEGEPSLTNYRPFEPWLTPGQTLTTRMKGVNLLDPKRIVDGLIANGVPENEVGLTNGGFWLKQRGSPQNFFPDLQDVFKPDTRYTLSLNGFLGEGHEPTSYFSVRFEYTDGSASSKTINAYTQRIVLTSLAGKTVSRIFILFYVGTNWTANLTEMMLIEGIVEAQFEPYVEPVSIEHTASEAIYGGVLSTDGNSLITHKQSIFDGSEAWSISNTSLIQTERFRLVIDGAVKDSGYSSHFKTLPAPGADEPMVYAESGYIYLRISASTIGVVHEDSDATKVAAFKSWLAAQHAAGTPVAFAYEVLNISLPTEDLGMKAEQWGWYKRPVTYLIESNAIAPTISVDYIEDATYQVNSLQPLLRSNTNLTDEFMWDGGYRYFSVERNIANTPMQSGHQWLYDLSEGNNQAESTLYSTNGVLQIRGGSMTVLSALYTNVDMPPQYKLSFGMSRSYGHHWPRRLFLKYIDSDNKLWLDPFQYSLSLSQMVDGVTSTLASTATNTLSGYHLVNEQYQIYYYFGNSGRKRIKVLLNDSVIIDHELDAATGNLFAVPTPFRIEFGGTTSIANLMVRDLQLKY